MAIVTEDDFAELRKLARAKKLGYALPYFKIVCAGRANRGVRLTADETWAMTMLDDAIGRVLLSFLEEQMDLEEEEQDER